MSLQKIRWEGISYYHKLASCIVSKNVTGAKEDKGSTVMLAMWLLQLVKRHVLVLSNIEQQKIKLVALSIVKLCLAEGIS